MKQYSIANQAFLLVQNPDATEVRPFSYWKANGRRVKKGEKALQVWVPVAKKHPEGKTMEEMSDDERKVYFRTGNVFDISQTETQEEWEARKEAEAKSETSPQLTASV